MFEPAQEANSHASHGTEGHPLDFSESRIGASMPPPPLQLQAKDGKKAVSGNAMKRLGHAKDAIDYTKGILKHGAGNQIEALKATQMNSAFRMIVARDDKYWRLTPKAQELADDNKQAYLAARAEVAEGGNCGEHANLAYQFLRHKANGETISRGKVQGFDHAFTFVGPAGNGVNMDNTAVADPWPTAPKAVLWEDHFAKPVMDNGSPLVVEQEMEADGISPKDLIKKGLTLSSEGEAVIKAKLTQEETDKTIETHEDERKEKRLLEQELKDLSQRLEALKKQLDSGVYKDKDKTDKEAELKQMGEEFKKKHTRLKEINIWMWGQSDTQTRGHDFDYHERQPGWLMRTARWVATLCS